MGRINIAMLVGALLFSVCSGQGILGMDWLSGLTENIDTLNRNIQQNVQQLHQQIQHSVRSNLAQVDKIAENLPKDTVSSNAVIVAGNSVIQQFNNGTRVVRTGITSNGKPYVQKTMETIVGDTLWHTDIFYHPDTNTTRTVGFMLNLADPNAKPVPINGTV